METGEQRSVQLDKLDTVLINSLKR
jgi:hypothetical protein